VKGDPPEGSPSPAFRSSIRSPTPTGSAGGADISAFHRCFGYDGDAALKLFKRNYELHDQYGLDYHSSFAIGERSMNNVNQLAI